MYVIFSIEGKQYLQSMSEYTESGATKLLEFRNPQDAESYLRNAGLNPTQFLIEYAK